MLKDPPVLTINTHRRRPTEAQVAAFRGIPTSFIADAMGGGGALDRGIRPLGEGRDLPVAMSGPALTVDCGPADVLALIAAQAEVGTGDIVVSAFGGHLGCAAVGDRVMGMLRNNGALGLVTDGPARDYEGIVDVGLPLFCTGLTPASPFQSGPGTIGLPVQIGGQQVASGDMIVTDMSGVVVIPFDRIDTVIAALEEIGQAEAARDTAVAEGLKIPKDAVALLASDRVRRI